MSVTLVWVNLAIGATSSALILTGIVVLLVWVRSLSIKVGKMEHAFNNLRSQLRVADYLRDDAR